MSRIGKLPIPLPQGVTAEISGQDVKVKGPKGELHLTLSEPIKVTMEDNSILVSRPDDEATSKSLHGLSRTLIANNVQGVSEGFSKSLEIVGTGYRAASKGSTVELALGLSHPVVVTPPDGANIRKLRKPEPYKGKGIRYEGERVRRKAGKAGK